MSSVQEFVPVAVVFAPIFLTFTVVVDANQTTYIKVSTKTINCRPEAVNVAVTPHSVPLHFT